MSLGSACRLRDDTAGQVSWRVVDSTWITPWDEMTDSVMGYRVRVSDGAWADTIASVVPPFPVTVDSVTVVGLRARRADGGMERELFRVRRGEPVTTFMLPDDLLYIFEDVMVSPRGQSLAYVGKDSVGIFAAVRTFPEGQVIVRGPTASGCDCDVDLNHARWVSRDSFEIAVVGSSSGEGWQIVTGNAAAGRFHVSYVASEPDWHTSEQ